MALLRKYESDLDEAIETHELKPKLFSRYNFPQNDGSHVFAIKFIPIGIGFSIKINSVNFHEFKYKFEEYAPSSVSTIYSPTKWVSFEEIIVAFKRWLKDSVMEYLKEESSPDDWKLTPLNNPEIIKLKRLKYLECLYEMTNANPMTEGSESAIRDELGLTVDETESIYYYLKEKLLIQPAGEMTGDSVFISDLGIDEVENFKESKSKAISDTEDHSSGDKEPESKSEIEVFISHSSEDHEIAARLITLIRSSLNLEGEKIRCTSVDGFTLKGGTLFEEQLKVDISSSKTFIGIITPNSLKSIYVLFELGARWGANKHMIPLLAKGLKKGDLKGPLSSIHILKCGKGTDLHQLVEELGETLGKKLEKTDVYLNNIEDVIKEDKLIVKRNSKSHIKVNIIDGNKTDIEKMINDWKQFKKANYKIEIIHTFTSQFPNAYTIYPDCEYVINFEIFKSRGRALLNRLEVDHSYLVALKNDILNLSLDSVINNDKLVLKYANSILDKMMGFWNNVLIILNPK